jgi:hypothetical protein
MVSWVFKLFLAFFGLVLMLGMLVFLLLYIVWASVRWLLTGQKPQVAVVWQRYREMRSARAGAWRPAGPAQGMSDDVVDVEVREVKPTPDPVKLLK